MDRREAARWIMSIDERITAGEADRILGYVMVLPGGMGGLGWIVTWSAAGFTGWERPIPQLSRWVAGRGRRGTAAGGFPPS